MRMKRNRMLSLLLCVALILTAIPLSAFAAEGSVEYVEYSNVANSYRGEKKTAPDKAGYVFAGWYEKDGSSYTAMSEAEADSAANAYAKFVDAKMLGVRYQLTEGTTTLAKETDLRLLTSVDSRFYRSVGFNVTLGDTTVSLMSQNVYEIINGYTKDGVIHYTPDEAFECDDSLYFMAYTITDIKNDFFLGEFAITPVLETLDGTIVYGSSRELKIEENAEDGTLDILTFDSPADMHNVLGRSGVTVSRMVLEGENVIGGSSATSNKYPGLTVNLGKTYDTNVTVTLKMMLTADTDTDVSETALACYLNSDTWTAVYCNNTWQTITFTVPTGQSSGWIYVNLEWFDWWDDVMFYFDDVEVMRPLDRTLTFDRASDLKYAFGRSGLALSQMELDGENVAGGSSATSNRFPGLNVNLGRTYDTDVTVTFKMLLEATSEDVDTGRELACYLNSGNWVPVMCNNTWKTLTITIPAGQSSGYIYVDLQWFDTWWDDVMFYFDDVEVLGPLNRTLTFDNTSDLNYVSGGSGLTISQMVLNDNNVIGGSSATSNRFPRLDVNLGRTYMTDVTVTVKLLLQPMSSDVNTQTALACYLNSGAWTPVYCNNTWQTITFTISAGQSSGYIYVDLQWYDSWWDDVMLYFDDISVSVNGQSDIGTVVSVSEGQKLYFGAVTKAAAMNSLIYNVSKGALGTVSVSDLTIVDSFEGAYGVYCYTVNDTNVKYIDIPESTIGKYYTYILKEAGDTSTYADIMNEFYSAFGVEQPSADTISALAKKNALFLGDSITYGAMDDHNIYGCGGWAGRIGHYCHMNVVNNGYSGACISTKMLETSSDTNYYIYNNLVREAENTYDYIIMHGLFNDAARGATLGTPQGQANFDASKVNPSNFADALELLFYIAKEQHPEATLGFIVNFQTEMATNQVPFVEMAIEICEDWGVPYLDLYHDTTFSVEFADGLHPNSAGYDSMYAIVADWMATL